MTSHFISHDPRNFAVAVSVGDHAAAFGLPATDEQNIFYGHDSSIETIGLDASS